MQIKNECIDLLCEIYAQFVPKGQIYVVTVDTRIFGCDTFLDSFSLVSFLVDVEQQINDKYNVNIVIADDRSMSQRYSPFRTINTLADYIVKLLGESGINVI